MFIGPDGFYELIRENKSFIVGDWIARVRKQVPCANAWDDKTVIDSLPEYLDEIARAILVPFESSEVGESVTTARLHGETRANLTYSVRDVAAEYSILREIMIELSARVGAVDPEVQKHFNRINDAGSINAVESFLEKMVLVPARAAQSAAEISQSYVQDVIDSSPAMVWITDIHSQCTYLSQQWYEYTGRTPAQDLGVGWLDNIHPDDLQRTSEVYANAIKNRGILRVDYRLRNRLGEYRWAVDVGHPRFDKDMNFTGYIGTVTDIHERLIAEKELQSTEERFTRSAAATNLGVWYCDLPFDTLIWNPEVREHYFVSPQERVTLETFYGRIHLDDREKTQQAIADSIANNAPYDIVVRTVNPHDTTHTKFIRNIGWTDYSEAGVPIRFDGITLDVTGEIRTQQQLSEAKIAADRANEAKSSFLANMSHEIRSPLGAVMGFADLACQSDVPMTEIHNYLDVIRRNSNQVLRIIDDILDLSKVEANRVNLEEIEFSLTEFIADFASLVGFRARENGIAFQVRAETDLPRLVTLDPTRLRQILTNAVGNAIKFTPKGKVTLHIAFIDGMLRFTIEDTGRGITTEQAEKLFQAFMQADASTTRTHGGTGLGLVLTRKLCELMGGDYVLEASELNQGSKFVATVRINSKTPTQLLSRNDVEFSKAKTKASLGEKSLKLNGLRVLLVEDSPDNQVLVRLILSKQGVDLTIASDGEEGVRTALANEFDLVLMDIQMPKMDGHEAASTLRRQGYRKPLIALTAHAMKDEVHRAKRSGFTDFVSKPIHRKELIEKIAILASR